MSKRQKSAERDIADLWIVYGRLEAKAAEAERVRAFLCGAIIVLAGVSCCVVSWLACRG